MAQEFDTEDEMGGLKSIPISWEIPGSSCHGKMLWPWALLLLCVRSDAQGIQNLRQLHLDQAEAIKQLLAEDVALEGTKEQRQRAEEEMQQMRLQETEERLRAEQRRAKLEEEMELEEEREEFTDVDFAESLMLLGGIAFVMTLFYLVNDEDPDMRFYSWRVISATLSIFSAVLIFSGINKLIHFYLLPHSTTPSFKLLVALIPMLSYFFLLQLGTAYESAALTAAPAVMDEKKLEETWGKLERRTRCWATILAHLTGFGSIHCGTVLQHMPWLRDSPGASFVAAPAMFLLAAVLNWCARRVRERVTSKTYQRLDSSDSPHDVTAAGEWQRWTYDLWTENVIDAEHDSAALAVSFLLVQSCRFAFSGQLADELTPGQKKSQRTIEEFAGFSLVFAVLSVALVVAGRRIFRGAAPTPGTLKSFLRRCWALLQLSSAMAFAWTLLFSARWEITRWSGYVGPPTSLTSRISLALAISFCAALIIKMLDLVIDLDSTEEDADEALGNIISSLGILVGFSWEQSFDGGVEVVALRTYRPLWTELALACAVVALILPAWRRHILEKVIVQEKKRTHKEMRKSRELR
eukprot:s2774_g3.t1